MRKNRRAKTRKHDRLIYFDTELGFVQNVVKCR